MRGKLRVGWLWLILSWLAVCVGVSAAQPGQWAEELRKSGVEPNSKGLEKYLESQRLTPELEAKIKSLLSELGSQQFKVREKATAELLGLPFVPVRMLKEAAERDAETRSRVQLVLSKPHVGEAKRKTLLVLKFIAAEKIKGLAPIILDMMSQWDDAYVLQTAASAVEASAQRKDAGVLRQAIAKSSSEEVRTAAVAALATVLEREADTELEPLLKDKSPKVRLEAAVALLNHDNRKAFAVLVDLLENESPQLRQTAAAILRAGTGQTIPYAGYDEPKTRAAAVARWREWVAKHGDSAKLQLPVRKSPIFHGRVLIGVWQEKKLREIDLGTGKTVFQADGFNYLWGCSVTPEGHRLAVDCKMHFVVEYDSQGKECWRCPVPGEPTSVERLPNGRTLMALYDKGQVIEMNQAGEVVWKLDLNSVVTTAQRLLNGNTLVCFQSSNKVAELNAKGEVVWELGRLQNPFTAQALDNGNVLICEYDSGGSSGGAKEFNRQGNIVWESKERIVNPAQAQRLPNGNTLISGNDGVTEYDPENKQVRHLPAARGRFFAY